jgi:SCP-2 sterol transfer family.
MPLDTTTLVLLHRVRERLNSSETFRNTVKGWSSRILVKINPPDPRVPYSYRVLMEVKDGVCTALRTLEPEENVDADIQVEMDIGTYEAMLKGETSSTAAFLSGKLKIRGKTMELLKRKAALEVLNETMREMLFGGGAIPAMLPYLKREFIF